MRIDEAEARHSVRSPARWVAPAAWAAVAAGLVLVGGGNLDLGPASARLGMAAGEGLGPYGQVFGGYDPALWVGRVLPSQIWAWGEGGTPTAASVRWPEAIAVLLTGLIVSRRLARAAGARAGVFLALTLFGTLAAMQRSAETGLDVLSTLAVVGAIDRIYGRGSDLVAGGWLGLAFLMGGWPPVALVLLTIVILGRPGAALSWQLGLPAMGAAVCWSAWVLSVAPAEAWAAALALPLTQPVAWGLAMRVVLLGLPFAPLAALWGWRSVREALPAQARGLVTAWLQATAVALLAGTLIPGLAAVGIGVALVGLAVAAATVLEGVWSGGAGEGARRTFLGAALGLILLWAVPSIPLAGYLAAAVSYYRQIGLLLAGIGVVLVGVSLLAAWRGCERRAVIGLAAVAFALKLTHWGVYVPEWNYRLGKGPWGRAVGQWVLPSRPLYTFHAWPADLLFHVERPIRQLPAPESLKHHVKGEPAFVLLLAAEFEHWPTRAPKLLKIREFRDESGFGTRVLARTEGDLQVRPTRSNGHDD